MASCACRVHVSSPLALQVGPKLLDLLPTMRQGEAVADTLKVGGGDRAEEGREPAHLEKQGQGAGQRPAQVVVHVTAAGH